MSNKKSITKLAPKQPQPVPQPEEGMRVWHPDSGHGVVTETALNGYSQVLFDNGAHYTCGNFNLYA
jgi:hypothetical protein